MNDLNTSTEATITTETAIGFIPCCTLADCTHETNHEEQKIKTITETFKQLRVDISEITIEDLIDNEDELFPEEKELEEKE